MLTVESLKMMDPHTIFAHGVMRLDEVFWSDPMLGAYYGEQVGRTGMIGFVAMRGAISDWAVYLGNPYLSPQYIATSGVKLTSKSCVRAIVQCTEGAWRRYRK